MERKYNQYYNSVFDIKKQFIQLFNRNFRYVILSSPISKIDEKVPSQFLHQTNIIVNTTSSEMFNYNNLYNIFNKALNDTLVVLDINSNLNNFKFIVSHTYYMIIKDNEKDQYSFFMGHGNQSNLFVHDNVYLVDGIHNLKDYLTYMLEINHIEEARMYFKEQFPHSNVLVDNISHIVFLIQPYNDNASKLKKKIYYINQTFDDLVI